MSPAEVALAECQRLGCHRTEAECLRSHADMLLFLLRDGLISPEMVAGFARVVAGLAMMVKPELRDEQSGLGA
jgi:hypothetical protein